MPLTMEAALQSRAADFGKRHRTRDFAPAFAAAPLARILLQAKACRCRRVHPETT